jgi:hypothetical protein
MDQQVIDGANRLTTQAQALAQTAQDYAAQVAQLASQQAEVGHGTFMSF